MSDTPVFGALPDYKVLADILQRYPTLSWRGWWRTWNEANDPHGTLERVRRETLQDWGLGQFRRAITFVAVAPRIKSPNRRGTTYALKHVAERWTRATNGDPSAEAYIGEGAFICACFASGLRIHRNAFGATYINLAAKTWAMGARQGGAA